MNKIFVRFISLLLIFSLLLGGKAWVVIPVVNGQDAESPTTAPAPTTAPKPTTAPTVKDDSPKPTTAPDPTTAPKPTTAPAPTSAPGTVSSPPQPTTTPQPPLDTSSNSSPTVSPPAAGSEGSSPTPTPSELSPALSDQGSSSYTPGSVNDPANTNTGAFSTNSATENNQNWQEVVNNNLAQLQNKIDAISNSGFNFANLNTLQGQVVTGDSLATLNLLNKLNSNMTGLGGFSVFNIYDTHIGDVIFKFADANSNNSFASASPTVSKNSVTGPGSTNNAIADNSFTVKEASGNDAKLTNDINLQAVSGENSASYNTGGGSIKTGNAAALGNIVNLANTNLNVSEWLFGVVNIFGTLAGNIILPQDTSNTATNSTTSPAVLAENSTTGPGSTNNATYNTSNTSNYTANNTADVTSTLNVTANTGENSASVNTGGGSVKTGSSDVSVSNSTIANTNTVKEGETVWMVIVNEAGKWVGHIIGAPWGATAASNALPIAQTSGGAGSQTYAVSQNNATGPLSTNNAAINNTSDTSSTINNTASIVNNITANADTGNNKAQYNTGSGNIETGNAKTGLNLVNMVNNNVVAKKFVAVLVNVLGTFLGDVVSSGQKASPQVASAGISGSNPSPTESFQPSPTPSTYQLPSFNTVASNIGGTSSVQPSADAYNYSADVNQNYPNEYTQAVTNVANSQDKLNYQSRVFSAGPSTKYRGIFISPAFAKATETSFAGMLLGGATFKVTQSWLSIVPITLVILLLRRRRKFDFGKYINALLEIVL